MLGKIASILEYNCLLNHSLPIIVGVSGGPDSLSLLDILRRLEYPLLIVHLDHGLRPESGTEALLLKQRIEAMGLPFILGKEDVEAFAEEHGQSIEEAARAVRYRLLFASAQEHHAQAVAVGHTADDQVETVLMHLLRGTGLSGLRGMSYRSLPNPWSEHIPLVRPLLSIWREQIHAYVQDQGLKPFTDPSNTDTRYYRNRLRHELIPLLESYNPGIRPVLLRTADTLREDYAALEAATQNAWRSCFHHQGNGYVAFDHEKLSNFPIGIQRQLIRLAINRLRPGLRDVDFNSVQHALDFLKNPPRSSQSDLSLNLRVFLEEDIFWVASWEADLPQTGWPQLQTRETKILNVPGTIILSAGWRLSTDWVSTKDLSSINTHASKNPDPFQAWLSGENLQGPLFVRTRRPGDRFKPFGMQGHSMKLSDFMVNVKMPQRARENWPLLCSGEEVLWVPGFRIAHPFRIKPETQQVIHLQLSQG